MAGILEAVVVADTVFGWQPGALRAVFRLCGAHAARVAVHAPVRNNDRRRPLRPRRDAPDAEAGEQGGSCDDSGRVG